MKSSPSCPIKLQKKHVTPNQQHLLYVSVYILRSHTETCSYMRESPLQVRSGEWWRVVWTAEIKHKCITDVWFSLPRCCRTLNHLRSSHLWLGFFALCHRKTTLPFNEAKDKWSLPEPRVATYSRTPKCEQLLDGPQTDC